MPRDLHAVDPALPVVSATTMALHLETSLAAPKAIATFIGGLGMLGLGLAAIGLYAVDLVRRVAPGPRDRHPHGARARTAARPCGPSPAASPSLVGAGTAVGVGLTLLAIMGLRATTAPAPGITLYRPTADPLALLAVVVFVSLVAAVAAVGPARRAATMDPLVALRRE